MSTRVYRGCFVERVSHNGYWRVQDAGDGLPMMADTLKGLYGAIADIQTGRHIRS